jgi:hypothetical protein
MEYRIVYRCRDHKSAYVQVTETAIAQFHLCAVLYYTHHNGSGP